MGIKHFFYWFKNQFSKDMYKMRRGKILSDINVEVDNLMIDMNGVFHNSSQKIYEYGNCKPPPNLLKRRNNARRTNPLKQQIRVFEDVCKTVEKMFDIVEPKKRLILCVDGPAPLSKQAQQRQRRFRSAKDADEKSPFDSNAITPGTKFMDYLSKYIDWYIRKRISEDKKWQNIEVIFSNEKSPGEGEHKIVNYIRHYGNPTETYCINGLDADLIMLSLGTHLPNFYVLREDLYDPGNEFFCINIGKVRETLSSIMTWKSETHKFSRRSAIDDFIFLCFIVGNDFLPHIPSIEIIEKGIEVIIEVYKLIGASYGHITSNVDGVKFNKKPLSAFLSVIGQHEKELMEEKLSRKKSFFPDPLVESCAKQVGKGKWELDIGKYRETYCSKKFPYGEDIKTICHHYFEGMQWVISYYTQGVPNWKWRYPYHYAPPASVLAEHMDTFVFPEYGRTIPSVPFQQLLSVLPPKSAKLIPEPLCKLLTSSTSPLHEYCPNDFEVDLSGKRKEWEGIVILPMVNFEKVREEYFKIVSTVDPRELKRNVTGRSFVYKYSCDSVLFRSFYGDIEKCHVKTLIIDL
jgi:5'-3' exoribonuclease 1